MMSVIVEIGSLNDGRLAMSPLDLNNLDGSNLDRGEEEPASDDETQEQK